MSPFRGNLSQQGVDHPLLDGSDPRPLKVLHLEDNEIDAVIFGEAAKRCDRELRVTRADSISQFRKILKIGIPHLICADHILPDGVALDAIKLSKELCPEVPFIVITGAGEEEVAVEYLRAGAADYLSKRRLDLFPTALNEVLERYRNKILRELAEQEALRINEELLALVRHVEEERDAEKRALSRDIHDQLGQELTALKLGLYWLQGRLKSPITEGDNDAIQDKLQDLIDLNTGTIKAVRNLAHALRPVVLDQVGLAAGIETLVRDFNARSNGFCGLQCDSLPPLSEGMQTDIFRIVQEALTNIARHSEANLSFVRLLHNENVLTVEIGDDGKGMNAENMDPRQPVGLGLVGMRERVRNHEGTLTVHSKPNMGTAIEVTFTVGSSD